MIRLYRKLWGYRSWLWMAAALRVTPRNRMPVASLLSRISKEIER